VSSCLVTGTFWTFKKKKKTFVDSTTLIEISASSGRVTRTMFLIDVLCTLIWLYGGFHEDKWPSGMASSSPMRESFIWSITYNHIIDSENGDSLTYQLVCFWQWLFKERKCTTIKSQSKCANWGSVLGFFFFLD
jgi:hypothetical protein